MCPAKVDVDGSELCDGKYTTNTQTVQAVAKGTTLPTAISMRMIVFFS
jgi:hypothetical protein